MQEPEAWNLVFQAPQRTAEGSSGGGTGFTSPGGQKPPALPEEPQDVNRQPVGGRVSFGGLAGRHSPMLDSGDVVSGQGKHLFLAHPRSLRDDPAGP